MQEQNTTKPPLSEADVSDLCDGMLFLLSALDCPRNVRLVFIALLGFLAGRQSATFYHLDLGRRAFGNGRFLDQKEMASIETRVSRTIDQMMQWAKTWGLPIDYTPGGKIEGQIVASRIKTPLLSWPVEVVQGARVYLPEGEASERERSTAFRQAATDLMKRKKITRQTPPERTRREQTTAAIYSGIITNSARYIAKKSENGRHDPRELINSFIWDLASRLEEEFKGKGYIFDPLPDAKTESEIDAETDGPTDPLRERMLAIWRREPVVEEVDTPEPAENFVVDESKYIDYKNVSDGEGEARGAHTPDAPPVLLSSIDVPSPELASIGDQAENKHSALMAEIPAIGDQWQALQAVLSVNCPPAEYLFKDDSKRAKQAGYQVTARQFAESLSPWLGRQKEIGLSFIARLDGPVILRDDIDQATAAALLPFSFLQTETSKGNFQAWIAYSGDEPIEEIRRRFHAAADRLKLTGNLGSTHSLRWPGSINFKAGREQWKVKIHAVNLGRVVADRALIEGGLLATLPEIEKPVGIAASAKMGWPGRWPDYQKCLASARVRDDGQPDRSAADFTFALTSLSWGFSPAAIAAEIETISEKAGELKGRERERYIKRTIERAAAAAASREAA